MCIRLVASYFSDAQDKALVVILSSIECTIQDPTPTSFSCSRRTGRFSKHSPLWLSHRPRLWTKHQKDKDIAVEAFRSSAGAVFRQMLQSLNGMQNG